MCFSAPASFIASGALLGLGAATYALARRKDKVLVAIPLLFGVQQFFEGVQWLYLGRGASSLWAGYGFLFFALIVWPAYVPFFVRRLEPDRGRRTILTAFVALGVGVATFFIAQLLMEPLRILERDNCVAYAFNLTRTDLLIVLPLYLLSVLGALFLSTRKIFQAFGFAIGGLALVAWILYERNFLSVWCFFAAVVSSLFFVFVQRRRAQRNARERLPESPRARASRD